MNNYVGIKAADKRRGITRRRKKRAREKMKQKRDLEKKKHFVGFADKADKRLSLWRAK